MYFFWCFTDVSLSSDDDDDEDIDGEAGPSKRFCFGTTEDVSDASGDDSPVDLALPQTWYTISFKMAVPEIGLIRLFGWF